MILIRLSGLDQDIHNAEHFQQKTNLFMDFYSSFPVSKFKYSSFRFLFKQFCNLMFIQLKIKLLENAKNIRNIS